MKKYLLFLFILSSFISTAQQKAVISGVITDATKKQTLIGVTVAVKGTSYGAVSDIDGKFKIELQPGTYNIEISYIGFEKLLYTGIKLKEGETKVMNIE